MSVTPQQMGAIVEKAKAPMQASSGNLAQAKKKKKPAASAQPAWAGIANQMLASGVGAPKPGNGNR
jgi:hypothetical protein